jgi:hypothetical protein
MAFTLRLSFPFAMLLLVTFTDFVLAALAMDCPTAHVVTPSVLFRCFFGASSAGRLA